MKSLVVLEKELRDILEKEFKLTKLEIKNRQVYMSITTSDMTKDFISDFTKHFLEKTNVRSNFMFWHSMDDKGSVTKYILSTEARVTSDDSFKFIIKSMVRKHTEMLSTFLQELLYFTVNIYIPRIKFRNSIFFRGTTDNNCIYINIPPKIFELNHISNDDFPLLEKFTTRGKFNLFVVDTIKLTKEDLEDIDNKIIGSIRSRENELRILHFIYNIVEKRREENISSPHGLDFMFSPPITVYKEINDNPGCIMGIKQILSDFGIETHKCTTSIKHTLDDKLYGPLYVDDYINDNFHHVLYRYITNVIGHFYKIKNYNISVIITYENTEGRKNVIIYNI